MNKHKAVLILPLILLLAIGAMAWDFSANVAGLNQAFDEITSHRDANNQIRTDFYNPNTTSVSLLIQLDDGEDIVMEYAVPNLGSAQQDIHTETLTVDGFETKCIFYNFTAGSSSCPMTAIYPFN